MSHLILKKQSTGKYKMFNKLLDKYVGMKYKDHDKAKDDLKVRDEKEDKMKKGIC